VEKRNTCILLSWYSKSCCFNINGGTTHAIQLCADFGFHGRFLFLSGGIERDWSGVPRQYHPPGASESRCACIRDTGGPTSGANAGTNRGDLDNPYLREYHGCLPNAASCITSPPKNWNFSVSSNGVPILFAGRTCSETVVKRGVRSDVFRNKHFKSHEVISIGGKSEDIGD